MAEHAFTLPLHCTRCGRAVSVQYLPESVDDPSKRPPQWTCPHWQCGAGNLLIGVQSYVAVWKGHGPRPIEFSQTAFPVIAPSPEKNRTP